MAQDIYSRYRYKTAIDTLMYCRIFYPNVKDLLQIFATITLTTATAERSFSSLRRLKNYMRLTMSEDRLYCLAIFSIHKRITVDVNEVIMRYEKRMKQWATPGGTKHTILLKNSAGSKICRDA